MSGTMTTEECGHATQAVSLQVLPNPFILLRSRIGAAVFMFQAIFSQRRGTDGAPERASHQHGTLFVVGIGDLDNRFSDYLQISVARHSERREPRALVFYIQHQFEGVWARHGSWDPMKVALEGSRISNCPKILQWFSGNIGLHHIHHVRRNIPNYNLQQCHDESRAFTRQVIRWGQVLVAATLGLCDEKAKRWLVFALEGS